MDDVKEIIELAKQFMVQYGYHQPMVFVKGTKGKGCIVLEKFGDTADKRVLDMLNVGTTVACKHNVGDLELIVLVNEAWIGMNFDVMPSQDPKRIEALIVTSLDMASQEQRLEMFKIVRDHGKIVDLKQISQPENGSVKSGLLPAFQKGYQIVSPVHN